MISCELAKKLKNAGFSQKSDYGYRTYYNGEVGIVNYHRDIPSENDVYIPTLSELIEACGDRFGSLERLAKGEKQWFKASGWFEPKWTVYSFDGETPEEAVANLWLELNKKI